MMTTYRLQDDGFAYKKIMTGRKQVGRVCRHAEGGYLGIIGDIAVRAPTEVEAFEEAAARAMGHADAATLHARNRRVRQARRLANAAADELGRRFINGNVEQQCDLVDRCTQTPLGASLLIRGVTRNLFRK